MEKELHGDLIETFKAMEFLILVEIFKIFSSNSKYIVKTDFKN